MVSGRLINAVATIAAETGSPPPNVNDLADAVWLSSAVARFTLHDQTTLGDQPEPRSTDDVCEIPSEAVPDSEGGFSDLSRDATPPTPLDVSVETTSSGPDVASGSAGSGHRWTGPSGF